jgi:hypothetical protein
VSDGNVFANRHPEEDNGAIDDEEKEYLNVLARRAKEDAEAEAAEEALKAAEEALKSAEEALKSAEEERQKKRAEEDKKFQHLLKSTADTLKPFKIGQQSPSKLVKECMDVSGGLFYQLAEESDRETNAVFHASRRSFTLAKNYHVISTTFFTTTFGPSMFPQVALPDEEIEESTFHSPTIPYMQLLRKKGRLIPTDISCVDLLGRMKGSNFIDSVLSYVNSMSGHASGTFAWNCLF